MEVYCVLIILTNDHVLPVSLYYCTSISITIRTINIIYTHDSSSTLYTVISFYTFIMNYNSYDLIDDDLYISPSELFKVGIYFHVQKQHFKMSKTWIIQSIENYYTLFLKSPINVGLIYFKLQREKLYSCRFL